jgi:hypothetical protein
VLCPCNRRRHTHSTAPPLLRHPAHGPPLPLHRQLRWPPQPQVGCSFGCLKSICCYCFFDGNSILPANLQCRHFFLFLLWLFIGTVVYIAFALKQSLPSSFVAAVEAQKSASLSPWQKVTLSQQTAHSSRL